MTIERLYDSREQAKEELGGLFGKGESYDFVMLDIHIRQEPATIVFMNGLISSDVTAQLLTSMQMSDIWDELEEKITRENFLTYFPFHAVEPAKDKNAMIDSILSGQLVFVMEDGSVFQVDVREYPGRQPEEPDNEKVIRGSRDGFTENIILNTALIRRRLRDPQLRFEIQRVTERGRTDIAIGYLKGVASEQHLDMLKKRLAEIDHDGLTMSDKQLEELLFKQKFHPVPFVRFTERPDIAAAHLLEGHIAIVVDTSPSVLLIPVTIFHHLQHAEEFRQAPLIGTGVRAIRFSGILMAVFLLPFWYLLVKHPEFVPKALDFVGPKESGEIPLLFQIIAADIGVEFMRLAAIHTPTPLSTALGLIAAVILGQMAVDVGLFTAEVILYVALTAVVTFAIPSYELSISAKIFRTLLLILTALAGPPGFFAGGVILFWYLCSIKPMGVPYLWPLAPFFPKAFGRVIVRYPMIGSSLRPYITDSPRRQRS
ncbi:GerA spore germination protein [Bhargavaea cecembensis DSE10]|uniref:GerA spore germination protein n=1 Tax=Bhargavaea cecembensis DSE10 TaxID=1235279 RepID=M7NFW9_9BACL|nr:spore germination protein [Bhargavaea cecembensis]EMR07448.1 GerA spore germination protein [Bhargavaea cecembensis DSE10]